MSSANSTERSETEGRVTLLISHSKDSRALEVRQYLEHLAQLGVTRRLYWLTVNSDTAEMSGDFEVEVIEVNGVSKAHLFDELSNSGGVTAADIAGIVVSELDETAEQALTKAIPAVRRAFEKWLRDAPINDIRVCGRSYDAVLPDRLYFAPTATTRVVIMPLDPSHDYSVFRPLGAQDSGVLTAHIAVELATLLGCWSVQNEIPVDSLRTAGRGSDGSGIHMVLSVVRALAVPAPPVSEALGAKSQLPAPHGYTAVPRPERLAASLADEIYPKELVFHAQKRPDGPSEFSRIDRFILRFIRQFIAAISSLPRVIRSGIQHEMDDLAIKAIEDAIGGAAASVGLVSPRIHRNAAEPVDFDALIGDLIDTATTEIDQNYRYGLPASVWHSMGRMVLTLADGAGEPRERLLTDDAVITDVDALVPACEPSAAQAGVLRQILETQDEVKDVSVVEAIAQRFRREIKSAATATAEALHNLRALPELIRSRPEVKGDEVIRIAAVIGASLILISLGAFSPLRPVFAFEWLPIVLRDAAWAFPSALGALVSVWALIHLSMKSERARRIVDVVSSLVIPLLLLTLLVQFADVRKWAVQNGGSNNYRYAVALFALFVILAVLAIRVAIKSPVPKHRAFGRAGIAIGSSYLVVAAVIGLAQDRPALIEGLPDVRTPIFVVLFPSAVISVAVSVSRIAIARVREIYKALLVRRLIEWGIGELRAGRDAEIRLEVLRVQWAALGAALTRLVRFPLGRDISTALERDDVLTGDRDPLKLDFARLDLTNRGRGGLEARLRQSVVRQGWLNQQLAAVFRSYSKSAGFDRGLTEDELTGIDPLACTATPSAEEASTNQARGDRWSFVDDFFEGNFEDVLRLPAEQIRFDALYESVLVDPKSIEIVGARHGSDGAAPFLQQAVSQGELNVPIGFLNLLVTGSDPRLNMKRLVWWPRSLVELPNVLIDNTNLTELNLRESELVKPWDEYGTRFAMSMQISWTEPFGYDDFLAARPKPGTSRAGAEEPKSEL